MSGVHCSCIVEQAMFNLGCVALRVTAQSAAFLPMLRFYKTDLGGAQAFSILLCSTAFLRDMTLIAARSYTPVTGSDMQHMHGLHDVA